MQQTHVRIAFATTLLAGLSTGIGSALALLTRRTDTKFLSVALGFSAGVMIYVSFAELLRDAATQLAASFGAVYGGWATAGSFFFGVLLIRFIDRVTPKVENPHEVHTVEEMDGKSEAHKANLMRLGLFTALAIAIHNFPEGLATFAAMMHAPSLGIPVAIAVAIHNIPEGIAIAVPVFYATGSRRRAFRLSFLSGLSEPVGALVAWLLLSAFLTDTVFGVVFGAVAGIMVYICIDELLPSAHEYGEHHLTVDGFIAGMAVMSLSLLLAMR